MKLKGTRRRCLEDLGLSSFLKIELYYIYIKRHIRVLILESREYYHEDGNLVTSHRCGFCFVAAS